MGVSGGDTAFAQLVQHGGVVDAQVIADSGQGPAEAVEVDGVVDLVRREAAAAHRHTAPVENAADRPPFDPEPVTEFGHRRAGLIAGDQLLDLFVGELPCTSGSALLGRRRFRCIDAGELLAELFQGPDVMKERGLRSSWGPRRMLGVLTSTRRRRPLCLSMTENSLWGSICTGVGR